MGGHGALISFLKAPAGKYQSVSAFSPIAHPTVCQWGEKAFSGYLKNGVDEGRNWDATILVSERESMENMHVLIDCGLDDKFYKEGQLHPEDFVGAAKKKGFGESSVTLRLHDGYDHSCTSAA